MTNTAVSQPRTAGHIATVFHIIEGGRLNFGALPAVMRLWPAVLRLRPALALRRRRCRVVAAGAAAMLDIIEGERLNFAGLPALAGPLSTAAAAVPRCGWGAMKIAFPLNFVDFRGASFTGRLPLPPAMSPSAAMAGRPD